MKIQKAIDLLNKMAKQQQLAKDKEEILAKLLITHETLKKKYRTLTEEIQVLLKNFKIAEVAKSMPLQSFIPV